MRTHITSHTYQPIDYNRILDFLREVYQETNTQQCWLPARFEYAEYNSKHLDMAAGWRDWKDIIKIWDEDGHIVAVANKESGYDAFLQIKPRYEYLAEEMIDYLEKAVMQEQHDGTERILSFCLNNKQAYAADILKKRGYTPDPTVCFYNYQDLTKEYNPQVPTGYRLVDGNAISDQEARRMVVHLGFHPEDEPNIPPPIPMVMEQAPMFRPDLEIMTQNIETCELCSFLIVWYDKALNVGYFEPVCTRLKFRKKGLAKAMIVEGLRRLKALGATRAYVGAYGEERKEFYAKAGFIAYDADTYWQKHF